MAGFMTRWRRIPGTLVSVRRRTPPSPLVVRPWLPGRSVRHSSANTHSLFKALALILRK